MRDAGELTPETALTGDEIQKSFPIFASTDSPAHHGKLSLSHVNAAFIEGLQAYFAIIYMQGAKQKVLNFNYPRTRYGERKISSTK